MLKKKLLYMVFMSLLFGLMTAGNVFGAYSDYNANDTVLGNWSDSYSHLDDDFSFTFNYQVTQDDNSEAGDGDGSYLYEYWVENTGTTLIGFTTVFDIVANVTYGTYDTGDVEPIAEGITDWDNEADYPDYVVQFGGFSDTLGPEETSNIFYLESMGKPGWSTFEVDPVSGTSAGNKAPVPVREPTTMFLLGTGLLGLIRVKRRKMLKS